MPIFTLLGQPTCKYFNGYWQPSKKICYRVLEDSHNPAKKNVKRVSDSKTNPLREGFGRCCVMCGTLPRGLPHNIQIGNPSAIPLKNPKLNKNYDANSFMSYQRLIYSTNYAVSSPVNCETVLLKNHSPEISLLPVWCCNEIL